jgi:hypothetical protein
MSFGPFFFAAPAALLALLALPALLWLLRATPPAPSKAIFPPLRILIGMRTEEESKRRAPLWLVLLRAFAAALAILGFARPTFAPQAAASVDAPGPVLIVLDNGWTSAPNWIAAKAAAEARIAEAERRGAQVSLLTTAPDAAPLQIQVLAPADARARLGRLQPKPWRPERANAAALLAADQTRYASALWINDGLDDPGAKALSAQLKAKAGQIVARGPLRPPRAIIAAGAADEGLAAVVRRPANGGGDGVIAAETAEGRALGAAAFKFPPGGVEARAIIALPPEIAARALRVRIVGETSAGATRLLPSGSGRPLVGLIDPGAQSQPLLSELFYVERAIQPFSTPRRGGAKALIDQGAQALILPDASRLTGADQGAIETWLEKGGLLIRFAGPRLANDSDELLPVRLRPGLRAMGGTLSWEKAQGLDAFPADSPFAGLTPPEDIEVRSQVLAEPASERDARIWARLKDGASLVSAAPRGRGLIVLFHVGGGPEWSNLPLSGLYVEMLKRTLVFAGRAETGAQNQGASGPYIAERLMDGFGVLSAPDLDAQPIQADAFAKARAAPASPPGLYSRTGAATAAIDAAANDEALAPLQLPAGVTQQGLDARNARPLGGGLLSLAIIILALDLMIALALAGRLPRAPQWAGKAASLALALAFTPTPEASAQSSAREDMRLAYVRTGDARADKIAQAGLDALAATLRDRTAVEPGPSIGVDPGKDDLSVYPMIYWLAPETPQRLPDPAIANLDRYMRLGGLLFVDTRDGDRARTRPPSTPGPAAIMLQGVDAPPLEVVGSEHVLTRAFYLLRSFPGRHANAKLYSEAANAAASRDGVASLFVGDGDWANAWANAARSGARQDELALRFGVNLVMVALTGNYKADQVHVPALLERMGQEAPARRRRQ